MEQTAIQEDVEEVTATGNPERDAMIASIAERARQERDAEIVAHGGEVVDTSGQKEEEKPAEVTQENETPEVKEEVPEEKAIAETVKIKVDGEEKEVPRDKIYDAGIRALQKESTADKRLEEATRLLREIETKYAQPQQQQNPSQEWDDQTVAYALEHGNEEQKAYAVSLLRGRSNTTPEQLVNDTTQRVLDTVDFQEASRKFATEYSDIVNDPYLLKLASIAEDEARASGDKRPRAELYKDIGDSLRKWKGGIVTPVSMDEKKELKAKNVINLPSASMKKTVTEIEKPKTTADIIEDMRKQRGQR